MFQNYHFNNHRIITEIIPNLSPVFNETLATQSKTADKK